MAESGKPERPQNKHLIPFKPGQSGNPAGAKKGWKPMKVRIRELLAAMPPEEVAKAAKKIGLADNPDAKDIMLLAQIQKAWKGDTNAAKYLTEYTDGKPLQKIEHSGPVRFEIVFEQQGAIDENERVADSKMVESPGQHEDDNAGDGD